MADDKSQQTDSTQAKTPPPDPAPEKKAEVDYKSEYEKVVGEMENLKKRQSGADKKLQAEIDARIAAEQKADEIAKSKMTAEEKLEYEKQIQKSKDEQSSKKLKELQRDKTVFEFMIKEKIDYDLKDFFKSDTEEGLKEEYDRLQKLIKGQVDSEISKRLNGAVPATGSPVDITVESYNKMNLDQKMKFAREHPDKFQIIEKQGLI